MLNSPYRQSTRAPNQGNALRRAPGPDQVQGEETMDISRRSLFKQAAVRLEADRGGQRRHAKPQGLSVESANSLLWSMHGSGSVYNSQPGSQTITAT